MIHNNLPLSQKHQKIIITVVVSIFALVGYGLYYHAHKQVIKLQKEYTVLADKDIHMQDNFNALQKKYDELTTKLQELNKDQENALQQSQVSKEKEEALQKKYDELEQIKDKLSKDLLDAQTKLGITPTTNATPTTTPAPTLAPKTSDQGAPTSTPLPQSSLENPSQKIASTFSSTANQAPAQKKTISSTLISSESYQCPASEMVSQNMIKGIWTDNKITWWVDFTSRPLNENESVKNLFKMVYDGQTVACYYEFGTSDGNTWLVIKGNGKNSKPLIAQEKGWEACAPEECKLTCSKDNLDKCHFKPQE